LAPTNQLTQETMIRQCVIIFGCLAAGELLVAVTGVKLPASIIGMLLLTLLLKLGWVKVAWVKGISDFLVKNLPLFFVPPGVAVMLYLDVIEANFWSMMVAALGSTVIVLALTGWTHQLLRRSKFLNSKRSVQDT
jgi:holin-like protein